MDQEPKNQYLLTSAD